MVTILKKTDIALIVLLLLFAGAFYFLFAGAGDAGKTVVVSVDGAVYTECPLSQDAVVTILMADGMHTNTLVVQDGETYMRYANCPDEICLRHRPIHLTGEMIVCLPNRIVVEISSGETEYDAVVE